MTTKIKVEYIQTCSCDCDGYIYVERIDGSLITTSVHCDNCDKQYVAIEVSEYGKRLQLGRRVYKSKEKLWLE